MNKEEEVRKKERKKETETVKEMKKRNDVGGGNKLTNKWRMKAIIDIYI
jgi:hypothetical protein